MNRENKRKQYEKGYYKNHACEETYTCRNCGRLVVPAGAGSDHRNHCKQSADCRSHVQATAYNQHADGINQVRNSVAHGQLPTFSLLPVRH
jgi:hypothetical protein